MEGAGTGPSVAGVLEGRNLDRRDLDHGDLDHRVRGRFQGRTDVGDDGSDVHGILATTLFDAREECTERVDHPEQHADPRGSEVQFAVPQPDQHVLAGVSQLFHPGEGEESTRPLDRVDGAENAGEEFDGGGFLFEGDQVRVEAVQHLVALHEELLDDVVHPFHERPPFLPGLGPTRAGRVIGSRAPGRERCVWRRAGHPLRPRVPRPEGARSVDDQ
jgi:hypothetical protein